MFSFNMLSSLPIALVTFFVSLMVAIASSARFTHKIEELCSLFDLSIGVLSLLSALGANIPNYASSALAMFGGYTDVGLGIIIGSNLYNMTIIFAFCALFTHDRVGITLNSRERRDIHVVASNTIVITLLSALFIASLPGGLSMAIFQVPEYASLSLLLTGILTLGIFAALLFHILKRSHGQTETMLHRQRQPGRQAYLPALLISGEAFFTLVIALGSVLVMVQSGQALSSDLHIPSVLAGLLILAVATSLPNTVVAISLVRSGEATACVEEVWSSGSINTVLGITIPMLLWPGALKDHFLLLLDLPLTLLLTAVVFLCIFKGRISRSTGIILLATYLVWVLIRFLYAS